MLLLFSCRRDLRITNGIGIPSVHMEQTMSQIFILKMYCFVESDHPSHTNLHHENDETLSI